MSIFCKKNYIFIGIIFFLAIQSFFLHIYAFSKEMCMGGYVSFFFSFVFWLAILSYSKWLVYLCLILKFLISVVLLSYHSFLDSPLTLSIIYHQFFEGLDAARKVITSSIQIGICIELILLGLNIFLYTKFLEAKGQEKTKAFIKTFPFIVFILAIWSNHSLYGGRVFYAEFCKTVGYSVCWLSELSVKNNKQAIIDDMMEAQKTEFTIPLDLNSINNIYIIQVESLAFEPMNSPYQGKEILPFLKKISQEGGVTEVIQNTHSASSNADLFVNIGSYYENNPPVLYNFFNAEQIYPYFSLLAEKAQKKGYLTHFFHNYRGNFFSRDKHIPSQGYQNIYFLEDMEENKPKEEWGIADRYLFEFVLAHQKKSAKIFNYIITVSSHGNYNIKDNSKPLFQGKNIKEKYYNAINYVDRSLENFIKQAPSDSLFIIFGDHGVDELNLKNIPLIVYSKQQNIISMPKKISPNQMVRLIHYIIESL